MKKVIAITILLCPIYFWSQGKEWHVKPYPDNYNNILGNDGTTLQKAMCLQYALNGGGGTIHGGDIIWLHGVNKASYTGAPAFGTVYKGHFKSTVVGDANNYIKVTSFPGEWAVIDGNVHNNVNGVNNTETQAPLIGGNSPTFILQVLGGYVHFDNFEITCLGNFSRVADFRRIAQPINSPLCMTYPLPNNVRPPFNFHEYTGIEHHAGVGSPIRNTFSNLVLRNIPGVAFASWKYTLDSEIYGNVFFNNGIIEVTGVGCTNFETHVANTILIPSGSNTNVRGHQTSIYTQNASTDPSIRRIIRNNIFINCYDSALNIWSSSNSFTFDYVKNYEVSKNIFINNGNPVPDETANMVVSTNAGNPQNTSSITNVTIESNLFYRNSNYPGIGGVRITGSEDVFIRNNFIYNGSLGMDFSGESNHKITFTNNLYVGKRMNVFTSIENYKNPLQKWNMDHNLYYTRQGYQDMFIVPQIPFNPQSTTIRRICLTDIVNDNGVSVYPNWFRKSDQYDDELNSFRSAVFTTNPPRYPLERTIINQNKYNPNKFYVTVYNPRSLTTPITVDFVDNGYDIPIGKSYNIRDVQNYFNIISNSTYAGEGITLPNHNAANFEEALPMNSANYGPTYVSTASLPKPVHSDIDFNTYVIEFECPGLLYDLVKNNYTDSATSNFEARNSITFGSGYIANAGANVTANAENVIKIVGDSWIKNSSQFLAKINKTLCSIALNESLENGIYFTNPEGIVPSPISEPDEGTNSESRAKQDSNEKLIFKIYPNPTNKGIVNLSQPQDINVYDLTGKLIYTAKNAETINTQSFNAGVYMVQTVSGETTKLVVK